MSSASILALYGFRYANVSLVGSGDVDLGKGARCTTTKIGSGDVICG